MSTLKVNAITNLNNEAQYGPVQMTAQASTSGTYIDFPGIPSWVKKITVMFSGVSTSGTSHVIVQVGSGSVQSSSYVATSQLGTSYVSSTAGFPVYSAAASDTRSGVMTIANITGNTWIAGVCYKASTGGAGGGGGDVALSGTLDRVRITTVNGTDTFDAGTINIIYE